MLGEALRMRYEGLTAVGTQNKVFGTGDVCEPDCFRDAPVFVYPDYRYHGMHYKSRVQNPVDILLFIIIIILVSKHAVLSILFSLVSFIYNLCPIHVSAVYNLFPSTAAPCTSSAVHSQCYYFLSTDSFQSMQSVTHFYNRTRIYFVCLCMAFCSSSVPSNIILFRYFYGHKTTAFDTRTYNVVGLHNIIVFIEYIKFSINRLPTRS